ncbi:hypothetical protein [Oceanobacillus sojae]
METVRVAFELAKLLKSPIILDCVGIHPIEEVNEIAYFYERKLLKLLAL